MRQEQEKIKKYERELFFEDRDFKIGNNSLLVSSEGTDVKDPIRVKIFDEDIQSDLIHINIYTKSRNLINVSTADEFELSEDTYLTILEIISIYYADSTNTVIRFNKKNVSIEELIGYLEKHVKDNANTETSIYRYTTPVYSSLELEREIHSYVNKYDKRAYVKIPYDAVSVGTSKAQLKKVAEGLQEYFGEDKYEIYAINSANEVYGKLTLDKLLGKEKLTLEDLGVNIENKYKGVKIIKCESPKQMSIDIEKDTPSSIYDMLISELKESDEKYNLYSLEINNDSSTQINADAFFDDGKKEIIELLEKQRDEVLKREQEQSKYKKTTPDEATGTPSLNKQESYDKEDYLFKIDIGDIDYSRYLDALSDFDSTTYKPQQFRIFGQTVGNGREVKLDLTIDEEYSMIKVRNYNAKINEETIELIKRIISKYYSKNTSYRRRLFYNDREIFNIDELMNILDDMKGTGLPESYAAESLGINTLDVEVSAEQEIHLHINTAEKTAYIKLPTHCGSLDLHFYTKEKLNKIAKDIIDKIGPDCKIYAINNAGEIYAPLTLDQLLGKEEIQSDIVGKTYTANTDKYSFDHPIIQTNEMNNRMTVGIRPYTSSKEFDEILEQIEQNGEKYSSYIWYGMNENKEKFRKTGYFKKGLEELKRDIKELRYKAYLTEQQENDELFTNDIDLKTTGKYFKAQIDYDKILNDQNAIIIEKDRKTEIVDKYIYDAKTGEKKHKVTLGHDKYNMYTPGTYINFVEFITNFLTHLYEKNGNLESLTFITSDNEELAPHEAMERALSFCSKGGGFSVGSEYFSLATDKDNMTYKKLEDLYDGSKETYSDGKVALEKGLYINKELIKTYFKSLAVKVTINENQDTTGIGQMRK